MKNEQKNNQDNQKKQEHLKSANTGFRENNQQPGNTKNPHSSQSGNSNIAVGNDGKIKAHDQWNNDDKQNNQDQKSGISGEHKDQQKNQVRSDKTITEPEIDAPIYDPEKTEKKIPQMQDNKSKK